MDNMNSEVSPTVTHPAMTHAPTKKSRRKRILIGVLIFVLLAAIAGAGYWWWNKTSKEAEKKNTEISSLQTKNTSLEKQLADAKAKSAKSTSTTTPTTCTSKAPSAVAISNIEASITSGNTAALEGYMASSVNVIVAASEGLGAKTPAQAVSSISNFISSDTTSWDYNFALPASILSSYGKGSYAQYFPNNATVGKATNKKVISFSFDCNGKISTVFVAANEDLLQ